jgi:hypothetical protein
MIYTPIGVHTGGNGEKNYGTFFGDLLGIRELFKEDVKLYGAYDKFDSFLKK